LGDNMSGKPELAGQTFVVIGGSSGIGLETARRARAEEADVILTARHLDRLHRVGLERGASVTAFDATDFQRLGRFFDELPAPIDHVLVAGPGTLLRAAGGVRCRKGTPRRRRPSVAAGARSARRWQGARWWNPALRGRYRRPPHSAGTRVHLGAHGRPSPP
jgi:NAD(P)-dependent dehydrogenase (short-subunit alcohol dehydrogenase family)